MATSVYNADGSLKTREQWNADNAAEVKSPEVLAAEDVLHATTLAPYIDPNAYLTPVTNNTVPGMYAPTVITPEQANLFATAKQTGANPTGTGLLSMLGIQTAAGLQAERLNKANAGGLPAVGTGGLISPLPPADTTLPPADTTLPPADTTLPPADTTLPPADTVTPAATVTPIPVTPAATVTPIPVTPAATVTPPTPIADQVSVAAPIAGQATTYETDVLPTPSTWDVTTDQTVQGQLDSILAANSSLMQRASASGLQLAADRGLLNSSMAIGSAQNAVYDAALQIATSDAAMYGNAAQYNTDQTNQANLAQFGAENITRGANAAALTDVSVTNANNATQINIENARAMNTAIAFDASAQNAANEFNANAINAIALSNAEIANNAAQFNANAANNLALASLDASTSLAVAQLAAASDEADRAAQVARDAEAARVAAEVAAKLAETNATAQELANQTQAEVNHLNDVAQKDADAVAMTANSLTNTMATITTVAQSDMTADAKDALIQNAVTTHNKIVDIANEISSLDDAAYQYLKFEDYGVTDPAEPPPPIVPVPAPATPQTEPAILSAT